MVSRRVVPHSHCSPEMRSSSDAAHSGCTLSIIIPVSFFLGARLLAECRSSLPVRSSPARTQGPNPFCGHGRTDRRGTLAFSRKNACVPLACPLWDLYLIYCGCHRILELQTPTSSTGGDGGPTSISRQSYY